MRDPLNELESKSKPVTVLWGFFPYILTFSSDAKSFDILRKELFKASFGD